MFPRHCMHVHLPILFHLAAISLNFYLVTMLFRLVMRYFSSPPPPPPPRPLCDFNWTVIFPIHFLNGQLTCRTMSPWNFLPFISMHIFFWIRPLGEDPGFPSPPQPSFWKNYKDKCTNTWAVQFTCQLHANLCSSVIN